MDGIIVKTKVKHLASKKIKWVWINSTFDSWMTFRTFLTAAMLFNWSKGEMVKSEVVADKRKNLTDVKRCEQEKEWRGQETGRKRDLSVKAAKENLLAENWGDAVESVTDVVCGGAWSVTMGWKTLGEAYNILLVHSHIQYVRTHLVREPSVKVK